MIDESFSGTCPTCGQPYLGPRNKVDAGYIESLSLEQARAELRYYLELHYELLHALRDLPELPSPFVLLHLGTIIRDGDAERGRELQRKHGLEAIPPKAECHWGAGVWARIIRRDVQS